MIFACKADEIINGQCKSFQLDGHRYLISNVKINMKCRRCNKALEKNHPWQECYDCIRTVYPET